MPLEDRFELTCRPARPTDTGDVMQLTSKIWEGEDYVPHVWNDWLQDPEGQLAVAEHEGQVIGLGKLTRLSENEWWLEGLRTHPDFEGRGVASCLHDHLLEVWDRIGSGALRLATPSSRLAVHHLCERTGFHKVGEFTSYQAEALAEPVGSFKPVAESELEEALQFVWASLAYSFSHGIMDLGWHWAAVTAQPLKSAIERGHAWWWQKHGGLLLMDEDQDEETGVKVLKIGYLACPPGRMAACLEDYRRLAGVLDYPKAFWFAPLHPELQVMLEAAGFHREWEASLFIYVKNHSKIE